MTGLWQFLCHNWLPLIPTNPLPRPLATGITGWRRATASELRRSGTVLRSLAESTRYFCHFDDSQKISSPLIRAYEKIVSPACRVSKYRSFERRLMQTVALQRGLSCRQEDWVYRIVKHRLVPGVFLFFVTFFYHRLVSV